MFIRQTNNMSRSKYQTFENNKINFFQDVYLQSKDQVIPGGGNKHRVSFTGKDENGIFLYGHRKNVKNWVFGSPTFGT